MDAAAVKSSLATASSSWACRELGVVGVCWEIGGQRFRSRRGSVRIRSRVRGGGGSGGIFFLFFRCVARSRVTHLERHQDALLAVHAVEPALPSLPLLVGFVVRLRRSRVGLERVDDGGEPLAESPGLVERPGYRVVPIYAGGLPERTVLWLGRAGRPDEHARDATERLAAGHAARADPADGSGRDSGSPARQHRRSGAPARGSPRAHGAASREKPVAAEARHGNRDGRHASDLNDDSPVVRANLCSLQRLVRRSNPRVSGSPRTRRAL